MASPTAIPHAETSSHHAQHQEKNQTNGSPLSISPTRTSPRSMVSPIYTQAGRSAFSMPGPNSSSTSPTTTTWYSAGFASGNSQRIRSPPNGLSNHSRSPGSVSSAVYVQRDAFPEASHPSHTRSSSFGSGSSAFSSTDLSNEPTTPQAEGVGAQMNRVSSIPLGTSFDQIKVKHRRRDSWGYTGTAPTNVNQRWSGFGNLRDRAYPPTSMSGNKPHESGIIDAPLDNPSTGMTGLLRKFSLNGGQSLKPPVAEAEKLGRMRSESDSLAVTREPTVSRSADAEPPATKTRGRQGSTSNPSSQRRKPSPMGERLLMGHFNAH